MELYCSWWNCPHGDATCLKTKNYTSHIRYIICHLFYGWLGFRVCWVSRSHNFNVKKNISVDGIFRSFAGMLFVYAFFKASSEEGLKDMFWYKVFFVKLFSLKFICISVCFYSCVVESFRTHESSWLMLVCVNAENGSLWNTSFNSILLFQYHLHQISHIIFLVFLNPGHQ